MNGLEDIISELVNKNLSYRDALALLRANNTICNLTPKEIRDSVFGVFNGPFLYGAMYVKDNFYTWTLYDQKNRMFGDLFSTSEMQDYVIEMVINGIKKMAISIGDSESTLQECMIRQSSLNVSGYKLR